MSSPAAIDNESTKVSLERFHAPMKAWVVFVSILVAVLALYGGALNNWWCCDDTQILKHAINFSPREYFFVPEVWRSLIPYSLTPWLTLTYDIDHALFGFSPAWFYAHNLLTIALCSWLIYLIARQWVDGRFALGGALMFLVGSPIAVASQQLMVRHYVEGLLFYLLAVFLFIKGMQNDRTRLGWLAGLAFAIASSSKEVYLPLGFVPFLLPVGNFRQRLAIAYPFLLVMLLYVPWRWYMLGDVVGGYTPVGELARSDLIIALHQFTQIPGMLLTVPGVWLLGGLALAGLVLALIANRRILLLWGMLSVLLLAPLVPLARLPGLGAGSDRYFVTLWVALALGTSIVMGRLTYNYHRWVRLLSLLVVGALVMSAFSMSRQTLADMKPSQSEQQILGRALASAEERNIYYVSPAVVSWYVSGIMDLRPAMGRTDAPPLLVADEVELADISLAGRRVLRYDPATQAMLDITPQIPKMLAQWCERLHPLPLSVEMTYDGKAKSLRWQFGPHASGGYVFLGPASRVPVPQQGALRMEKRPEGRFRLRYDATGGGLAYTPLLSLSPADDRGVSRLSWRGNGGEFTEGYEPACRLKVGK